LYKKLDVRLRNVQERIKVKTVKETERDRQKALEANPARKIVIGTMLAGVSQKKNGNLEAPQIENTHGEK
jgi:hypothetical protein